MRVNKNTLNPKGQCDMWLINELGEKFADVLYQLRCDIIHVGIANMYADNKGIYLQLGESRSLYEFKKYRIVSVELLCETIFSHIDSWCLSNSINNFKYTYVFDMENNNDDRILFNRLCESEMADKLEKDFKKYTEGNN